MNAVTKKLNSKSGISLAIALVFFLLCAMVGTVVLSAASASAGSTARERQLYRETAALTSAAELLSKDLQKMTFTGARIRTETETTTIETVGNETSTKVETNTEYRQAYNLEYSKFFKMVKGEDRYSGNLILNDLFVSKYNQNGTNTPANPVKQAIKFSAVPEQHIPEVTGTLTVEGDFTITVVLQCGKNSLTMSFQPRITTDTSDPKHDTKREPEQDPVTVMKKITTTYTTTISWEQPVIQEGGASNGETP